jgi:hypothetical protein
VEFAAVDEGGDGFADTYSNGFADTDSIRRASRRSSTGEHEWNGFEEGFVEQRLIVEKL